MRLPIALVAVGLTALAAVAGGKKSADLSVFESAAGRFKAMLGDDPKDTTQTVQSAAGPLEVNTLSTKVSDDLILSVTWTDYPESFSAVPAEKLLAAARDGLKTKKATLLSEKAIKEGEAHPSGIEVHYDHGKSQTRTRLYVVGMRLFQVTATGKKDEVGSRIAALFLSSFELMK